MTFGAQDRFRQNQKKTFKGHLTAGYACGLDMSPDGAYVVSGDGTSHTLHTHTRTRVCIYSV